MSTDSSGNNLAQYTYEAFGNTTAVGTSTNPYQYTGRENDSTGVYYYRARYYSPILQRFISEDPLQFKGNSVNFYEYTYDSPTNHKDPSGEQEIFLGTTETLTDTLEPVDAPIGEPVSAPTVDPSLPLPPAPPAPLPPPNLGPGNPFAPPIPLSGPIPTAAPSPRPSPNPSPAPSSPMPGRKSPKNHKVKKCYIEAVGEGYCTYKCDDGTTTVDPSCDPIIYPPASEPW